jgi:4-amino-4-deoxy-L-arabinose transferase-like glycosyltransferase
VPQIQDATILFPSQAAVSEKLRALTPARTAFALVVAASLLHLLAAGRVAFSVDEAHYALYGLFPDWSYFDHPPMVGWLQALVIPFSHAELALRLWPVAIAALASLALYRLTEALFAGESPWLPAVAVAALQSAVLFQFLSLALVPEDPLLLFGLLGALQFHRALQSDGLRHWLLLGLVLGLAGLSKYTAVVLVLSIVAVLVAERRLALLRRPGPWLAALAGLALVTPVFFWNAQHEWISLAYQWGHGAPARSWSVVRFLRSTAGQVLAFGGVAVFGTIALTAAIREWRHPGVRFSLLFAGPALLVFAWSAGFEETLPHWTLLGWALAMPVTARWIAGRWAGSRAVRIGVRTAVVYALLLVLAVHAQFIRPWVPFAPFEHPLADLYGWREAGERARALADERQLPLMVGNWTHASRLAWYAERPVQVLDNRVDQFDLWYGLPAQGGSGIVVLPEKNLKRRNNGLDRFGRCDEADSLTTFLDGQPVHTFFYFECRDYRGHP